MSRAIGGLVWVNERVASGGGVTHNSSIATGGVFGGIDPSHFSLSRERERAARDRIYLSLTRTCLPPLTHAYIGSH